MQEYRSRETVRAILFDPNDPSVYDALEYLGCLVNRREGMACTSNLDKILPYNYVVETHPDFKLKMMDRATFEGKYESIEVGNLSQQTRAMKQIAGI